MTQSNPFDIAASKVGLNAAAPALRDFLYTGGQNLDPATRAWCADFVNASLRQSGLPGTYSGMARSFLNYGQPVDQPQKGDIAVFTRGDPNGPQGHVAFFDSMDANGNIKVLGGNQGADHGVNYGVFPQSRLLGYRRPVAGEGGEQPTQVADANPQAPQMPAYAWTPPSNNPQAPSQQQASAAPSGSFMTPGQYQQPTFEQIGKMLGLEDPPPLQFAQMQQPRPRPLSGAFSFPRRA